MAKKFTQAENSLQVLLKTFSSNPDEAAVAYVKLRESLVRFFQIKGDGEPDEAADLTFDRVALKISQNATIEDLTKYCYGVARYIFLERIKRSAKNKMANAEFYRDKDFSQITYEQDDFLLLKKCLERLNDREKEMLQNYFTDIPYSELNENRRKISLENKISLNTLRLKIFRLRKRLEDCVKNNLE